MFSCLRHECIQTRRGLNDTCILTPFLTAPIGRSAVEGILRRSEQTVNLK